MTKFLPRWFAALTIPVATIEVRAVAVDYFLKIDDIKGGATRLDMLNGKKA